MDTESALRDAMDQILGQELAFVSRKKNPAPQMRVVLPVHLESSYAGV
jgi:hypothetical protein